MQFNGPHYRKKGLNLGVGDTGASRGAAVLRKARGTAGQVCPLEGDGMKIRCLFDGWAGRSHLISWPILPAMIFLRMVTETLPNCRP
jgi:hypothetical protein